MKIGDWEITIPADDKDVVVIKDKFGHERTIDVVDFERLMDVLHSVQDY